MKHSSPWHYLHLVLALGPLCAFAAWFTWAAWQVQGNVTEVDGLTWGDDDARLTAHRQSTAAPNEIEIVVLRITDSGGKVIHQQEFAISWGRWNWGLVEAMQVDADPELEIVFIDRGGRQPKTGEDLDRAFYLDLSSGHIEQKPLTSATHDVMTVIDWWASLHTPLTAIMLLVMYYLLVYLPLQLFRVLRDKGSPNRDPHDRIEPTVGDLSSGSGLSNDQRK